MATNLNIDPKLIDQAVAVGKHRTKREAVETALRDYVQKRKRVRIQDLFGTVDFDPDYDYKAERRRKRGG